MSEKKHGTKCPENARRKHLGDKKAPRIKKQRNEKTAPKKGDTAARPKSGAKTRHNVPKDRKTKTQFVDQKVSKQKNIAPKKNSAKKGDTSACPKSGAKNKAQRAQRPQDGNSIWRDQKVSNQKNSAAKKHHQKRDTVCPKSGAKNKAQRAQRTQDGNILETKSPQEKNSAAKKYRQKRGHGVSQKTRHDVPRTRKPKTHLGDEGVPVSTILSSCQSIYSSRGVVPY